MSESKETSAVSKMIVPGLHKVLSAEPLGERKYFRDLKEGQQPLMPVPDLELEDVYYDTGFSQQCTICRSPFRTTVEHVYIANGEDVQSVRHYFKKYYDVRIGYNTVQIHMDKHCRLKELRASGLRNLAKTNEEIDFWAPRPTELAMRAVLKNIDDVQGIRTNGNPELAIKKANTVNMLTSQLLKVREAHKHALDNDFDAMAILTEIAHEVDDPVVKQKILMKIRSVRERFRGGE